ncbi:nuclear transport factor 2 family protein [Salegentibacter chungangensis]|uniref:Nuclear transport factor 2 family protein n=1 Tax=Salegentibacter chungangensis TaxID=1335724 RepID=A0ABW3NPE5_9FLAO
MKQLFLLLTLLTSTLSGLAQVSQDSELYLKMQELDSLLFEAGFNNCKIEAFEPYISEDLEFYHDQSGLSTSKEVFLKTVRQNICSNPAKKPIRKLNEESLEVFPLYENGKLYGAIQKGEHNFYIKEPQKEAYFTSAAKFTHVWLLEDEEWTLKRVLSYDHKTPEQ